MNPSTRIARRLAQLTVVEIRKLLVTRSTLALLTVMAVAGLGLAIGATILAITSGGVADLSLALTALSFGVGFGAPIIGVLVFTSDWQHREIVTVFLLEPRRGRTYLAKLLATACVAITLVIVVAALAGVVSAVVALIFQSGWIAGNLGSTIGILVSATAIGAVSGSAIGAALLNAPLAIVFIFVQTFLIDTLLSFAPYSVGGYFQASSLSDVLLGTSTLAEASSSLTIWILIPLGIGYARHMKREAR